MKSILQLSTLVALLMSDHCSAQQLSINGSVVADGGGTASGGHFQVTGTIAQAEAGPRLTGGCFSVDSGFWGHYAAISTPGVPTLRTRVVANYVRVSFTPSCGDWVLQWTRDLETGTAVTVWTDDEASNLILIDGELTRDFHIPSWGSRLYFRLRQP